jgi:hypothetical protein
VLWEQIEDWRVGFYTAQGAGGKWIPWAEEMIAGATAGQQPKHARLGFVALSRVLAALAWTAPGGVTFGPAHWCRNHPLGTSAGVDPIAGGCWEPTSTGERAEVDAWLEWVDEQPMPSWASGPLCHRYTEHTEHCAVWRIPAVRVPQPAPAARVDAPDPSLIEDVRAALTTLAGAIPTECDGLADLYEAVIRCGYELLFVYHATQDARPAAVKVTEVAGIYEALLGYAPSRTSHGAFTLSTVGGTRKQTGTYYTPDSLVDLVLDEALDPVLDAAEATADTWDGRAEALLKQTVMDPSCGSGQFPVRAARRIGQRVASARVDGRVPAPAGLRLAVHEAVSRCIYGVDLSPIAVEIARTALAAEALVPGLPLPFLDPHVKVGNAILGTTPALLAGGIPDAAFTAIQGDDKNYAALLRRRNAQERERAMPEPLTLDL